MMIQEVTSEQIRAYRTGLSVPTQTGNYWTDEDKESLRRHYEAGVGISTLAYNYMRTETAIVQQLMQLGVMTQAGAARNSRPHVPKCQYPDCPHFRRAGECGADTGCQEG